MNNEITAQELEDAILLITGSPEWKTIQKGLYNEINASYGNALSLQSWEAVCEERGFVRGLYYTITLREQLLAAKKQAAEDANV